MLVIGAMIILLLNILSPAAKGLVGLAYILVPFVWIYVVFGFDK
jgi:hypothetical protein